MGRAVQALAFLSHPEIHLCWSCRMERYCNQHIRSNDPCSVDPKQDLREYDAGVKKDPDAEAVGRWAR